MPGGVRLPQLRRRRIHELLLSAASVATGIGLLMTLELGARALSQGSADAPNAPGDGIYEGHIYSERLGWEPRPGARFLVDGAPTSINSLGFRGEALPREPQSGRVRVVLLGDSVAFGYGVADGQTFAHLLDPERVRFETVNLAVPGYGIDQSLLRYELSGREWQPHVVVLNLCIDNDLADIMLPVFLYDGQHPKPRFSLHGGNLELHDEQLRSSGPARLALWLRDRSHFYRRLASRHSSDPQDRAEQLVAALVGRLRRHVEHDGARLVLAIHPNQASYHGDARWVNRLTQRPELEGLQIVPLEQAYRQSALGFGRLALDGIGHLNPRGHRLAADFLRAALEHWPASSVSAPMAE